MKIFVKLLVLTSILIAENNHFRCGFMTSNIRTGEESERPALEYLATYDTEHFRIHYDTEGDHAPKKNDGNGEIPYPDNDENGHPDYIDELAIAAEYSYSFMFDVDGLNYLEDLRGTYSLNEIMSDCDENISDDCSGFGGNSLYDIYVENMDANTSSFTYGSNESEGLNSAGVVKSFIIIDNGMTEEDDGEPIYYTQGLDAMRTTIAHEFFHAIQRCYRNYENGADGDFYELSSSWIEDIIYPDINDYCNYGWTSDFFDYDGMLDSIDETDGYSIALYAHYLTSVVANKDYSIIKHIWEDYRSLPPRKPVRSIDNVLKNEIYNYNTNFIDTWVDFISHNFFNGFYPEDSEYYYHPDQAITQPMTFNSLVPYIKFESPILVSKNISNESATLISINRVNQESQLDIAMNTTLENSNLIGNIILLSENNLDSQKIIDINDISEEIYDGIEYIYFVLGLDEPISSNEVIEDIDFDISFCNYLSKGDLKSDCILNVLDYIELIENIIFNEPFMSSCDLNEDTVCDAADAVLLISLILETP